MWTELLEMDRAVDVDRAVGDGQSCWRWTQLLMWTELLEMDGAVDVDRAVGDGQSCWRWTELTQR